MHIDRKASYRRSAKQFIIFGVIGLLNTALDFMVYWLLISISVYYVLAQIISYAAGMLTSYILNSMITFKGIKTETKKAEAVRGARFIIWNVCMLLLSVLLLYSLKEIVLLTNVQGKIIVTIVIAAINFIGSKLWVFREKKQTQFEK